MVVIGIYYLVIASNYTQRSVDMVIYTLSNYCPGGR